MKIIQLADLHVGEKKPDDTVARNLMSFIGQDICEGENVAVCVCGDIIDKGSKGKIQLKYDNAKSIFMVIKDRLDELKCHYKFMFVPGNHDINDRFSFCPFGPIKEDAVFEHFCNFTCEITGESVYGTFKEKGLISFDFGGLNWILVNSSYHAKREYGQIEKEDIENAINEAKYPSVILMHHALLSDGSEDTSTLRNGYQMLKVIENKTIAILHGHTHGFKNIKIGNTCLVVGVGPFYKEVPGINKQLNLIFIGSQGVNRVKNFYWRDDIEQTAPEQQFVELYHYSGSVTYSNCELRPLISQVRSDVQEQVFLHNVAIHYQATFEALESQIEESFSEDLIIAQEWQNPNCPDTLYYNHGSLIHSNDSMKYVKEMLQRNPTSRRSLITLINQNTVQGNKDGFLPSFDVVQFSFSDLSRRELVVTLNMRALEVSHFLSVNFCELYLLMKQLLEDLTFNSVNISVFAHRVTYIKDFYGFRKSELDRIKKTELEALLKDRDYSSLIRMLEEKKQRKETLLHTEGIDLLLTCVKNSSLDRKSELSKRIEYFKNAIVKMNKKHTTNSSSYDYEKDYYKSGEYKGLEKAYNSLITEIENAKGGLAGGT